MRRALLIAVCMGALSAQAQFGPPQVIMQGAVADPQRVDTIDIDHDGDLDLLQTLAGSPEARRDPASMAPDNRFHFEWPC
jgi:hypothetical protein